MAHWRYEFEDTGAGLPGHRIVGRPAQPWFAFVARVMGDHSGEHAEKEMDATLANLAAAVE